MTVVVHMPEEVSLESIAKPSNNQIIDNLQA